MLTERAEDIAEKLTGMDQVKLRKVAALIGSYLEPALREVRGYGAGAKLYTEAVCTLVNPRRVRAALLPSTAAFLRATLPREARQQSCALDPPFG